MIKASSMAREVICSLILQQLQSSESQILSLILVLLITPREFSKGTTP